MLTIASRDAGLIGDAKHSSSFQSFIRGEKGKEIRVARGWVRGIGEGRQEGPDCED